MNSGEQETRLCSIFRGCREKCDEEIVIRKAKRRYGFHYRSTGNSQVEHDLLLAVEIIRVGVPGTTLELRFGENLEGHSRGSETQEDEDDEVEGEWKGRAEKRGRRRSPPATHCDVVERKRERESVYGGSK